jgi:hypothetical protein
MTVTKRMGAKKKFENKAVKGYLVTEKVVGASFDRAAHQSNSLIGKK